MSKSLWLRAGLIAIAVLVIDQITKSWAENALADRSIAIAGPIDLSLVYNPGIAFGIGSGFAPYLVVIAILVIVAVLIKQRTELGTGSLIAVGLVLGGAFGNLCDRLFRDHGGAVVDFIDIGPWPVFNLADVAVVSGAFALAFVGARSPSSKNPENPEAL